MSGKPANKYFVVAESKMAGLGGIAIRKIRRGTRIIEYIGERISSEEGDRREEEAEKLGMSHHTFLFIVDGRTCVDAAIGGNDARFINHSCDPNCETFIERGRIYIDALKTIHAGDELSYDYMYDRNGESDEEARRLYPCNCGSAKCRGTIMRALPKRRRKKATPKKRGRNPG